ncbi:hypothetical protein [Rhodoblastus sp.]|uniref:hypothetical protein n=1 Tax=Rhodoblastus sp. TaxID=1962975 RepID=UPI003F98FAAC
MISAQMSYLMIPDWLTAWEGPVLFVLRSLAAGSLITFLVTWLGRRFIEDWLSTKFKERLQNLQFEQSKETERLKGEINQEIEHLKGRINAQADRRLRLHQYEFETLPRLWQLIDKAFLKTSQAVVGFEQFPDLNGAPVERIRAFAHERGYSDTEEAFLIDAQDKIKAISHISKVRRHNAATTAIWKLRRYNARNGIFWQESIRGAVDELCSEMNEVMVFSKVEERRDLDPAMSKKYYDLIGKFTSGDQARLTPLRTVITNRLNANIIAPDDSSGAPKLGQPHN